MQTYGTIEELCHIEYGTRVVKKNVKGNDYPVYGGGGESFRIEKFNRISRLVISRFGMSSKCTRFVEGKFFLNDSGLTLSPKNKNLSQEYLDKLILGLNNKIFSLGTGSAQKNLSLHKFRILNISYPSLQEQKRIVVDINDAFFEIDKLIETARYKCKNSTKIFDNYLSNIFQTNNSAWEKESLKNVTLKIGSGATPKGGKDSYKKEGIALIRSMNVRDLYFKQKDLARIDNEQARKLSNVELKANDILLNITGASVARCCLVQSNFLPARVNQHVSIIRLKEKTVIPKFLMYGLVSKPYKDELLQVGANNGATRQAITKKQIEEFEFKYPSNLEIQTEIIYKLEKIYTYSENIEKIYKNQINLYEVLKSAIFSRELKI